MPVYRKEKKDWTKDGRSYYFRCYYINSKGKRKQKESKLFFTNKEAKNAERDFLNSTENNKVNKNLEEEANRNITFEEVYYEWLDFIEPSLKSTTFYGQKKRCNKHILKEFQDFKLHYIKTKDINSWIKYMRNQTDSPEYLNVMISHLKKILTYAKENYDFDNKVVAKIQKVKIELTTNKKKDSEWNFWTYDEFQKFITVVDNDFWNLVFNFLYYTGVRKGEMMALTWNDIDFQTKQINIDKTLSSKVENKKYIITDPKTKNSIRKIDIDDDLAFLLQKHYFKESKIYNFNKNMFVFGNANFLAATTLASNLDKYINKVQEKYSEPFKRITPHGFRHSHVSLLIYLNLDSKDVAERIGDTIRTVEETYYHMFPNKKSKIIKTINEFKNK